MKEQKKDMGKDNCLHLASVGDDSSESGEMGVDSLSTPSLGLSVALQHHS